MGGRARGRARPSAPRRPRRPQLPQEPHHVRSQLIYTWISWPWHGRTGLGASRDAGRDRTHSGTRVALRSTRRPGTRRRWALPTERIERHAPGGGRAGSRVGARPGNLARPRCSPRRGRSVPCPASGIHSLQVDDTKNENRCDVATDVRQRCAGAPCAARGGWARPAAHVRRRTCLMRDGKPLSASSNTASKSPSFDMILTRRSATWPGRVRPAVR